MPDAETSPIKTLLEIMARLRDPAEGCPWDVEQTFETIAPYTLEEAYEVDHAIRTGDMESLCDELGDLLLQVVFHAQMAREAGHFAFDDVAAAICDKLIRRHPHIFGDSTSTAFAAGAPKREEQHERVRTAQEQTRFWEESKARERAQRAQARAGPLDPFDGIPTALPALARAVKLKKRAARLPQLHTPSGESIDGEPESSFDLSRFERALVALVDAFPGGGDRDKSDGAEAQRWVGQLLIQCVDAARALGVDPEDALRSANFDFEARINEALLRVDPAPGKRS